jgi:hypothetical protein
MLVVVGTIIAGRPRDLPGLAAILFKGIYRQDSWMAEIVFCREQRKG